MVYSRNAAGRTLTFGISGRLYKSNVLLYDHQTESLWSQLMNMAIAGPMVTTELDQIPSSRVSFKKWLKKHPDGLLLSDDTGYNRDYSRDPYEGYYRVGTIWFPVGDVRGDLSPKDRILGIELNGTARAYPLEKLTRTSGRHVDRMAGQAVVIKVENAEVVSVEDTQGDPLDHIFAYWFAWQAFHPETTVWGKVR